MQARKFIIVGITITFLSLLLPSCSNNALLNELENIENNSLNQNEWLINQTTITTLKSTFPSIVDESTTQFGKFNHEDLICYSYREEPKKNVTPPRHYSKYHIGEWGYNYTFLGGEYSSDNTPEEGIRSYLLNEKEINYHFFYNSIFDNAGGSVEQPTNATIGKEEKDGEVVYKYTLKDFKSLFNNLTGNQFLYNFTNSKVSLPNEMVIYYYTSDNLIKSIESSLQFSFDKSKYAVAIKMDFAYSNDEVLPDCVAKEVIKNKESSMLLNGEIDFVKEISFANKGNLPPTNTYIENDSEEDAYYTLLTDSSRHLFVYYDGYSHIVSYIMDDDRITVYDASTFKELYTVIFRRRINHFSCSEGIVFVRLEITDQLFSSYRYYDLNSFTLFDIPSEVNGTLIANHHIVYSLKEENKIYVKSFDTKTKETAVLYIINTTTTNSETITYFLRFYYDKEHNIIFVYYKLGKQLIYAGFDATTNKELYEHQTDHFYGHSSDPSWTGNGLSFGGFYTDIIDAASGEIKASESEIQHNYVLPAELADYTVYPLRTINEKYDIIFIRKQHYIDSSIVQIEDEKYCVYNKESDSIVATIKLRVPGIAYITNDETLICYYGGDVAFIKLH